MAYVQALLIMLVAVLLPIHWFMDRRARKNLTAQFGLLARNVSTLIRRLEETRLSAADVGGSTTTITLVTSSASDLTSTETSEITRGGVVDELDGLIAIRASSFFSASHVDQRSFRLPQPA